MNSSLEAEGHDTSVVCIIWIIGVRLTAVFLAMLAKISGGRLHEGESCIRYEYSARGASRGAFLTIFDSHIRYRASVAASHRHLKLKLRDKSVSPIMKMRS